MLTAESGHRRDRDHEGWDAEAGIYTVDLRDRVLAAQSGNSPSVSVSQAGNVLASSEMNGVVGDALATLRKKWGN